MPRSPPKARQLLPALTDAENVTIDNGTVTFAEASTTGNADFGPLEPRSLRRPGFGL